MKTGIVAKNPMHLAMQYEATSMPEMIGLSLTDKQRSKHRNNPRAARGNAVRDQRFETTKLCRIFASICHVGVKFLKNAAYKVL